jgi:hypothetical protein
MGPDRGLLSHPVLQSASTRELYETFTLAGTHLIDYLHHIVCTGRDPDTGAQLWRLGSTLVPARTAGADVLEPWAGVTWDDMARALMHKLHVRTPVPRDADGKPARPRRIDPDTDLDWRDLLRVALP